MAVAMKAGPDGRVHLAPFPEPMQMKSYISWAEDLQSWTADQERLGGKLDSHRERCLRAALQFIDDNRPRIAALLKGDDK